MYAGKLSIREIRNIQSGTEAKKIRNKNVRELA
jgi:hypothetical protein